MGGATLVISPLIALMEDQEEKLKALGVRAGALHSGKPREESRNIFRQYVAGKLDFSSDSTRASWSARIC